MSYFTESNDENDLGFLYHHPSCYKKYAEYKKLPILHETVSNILVGTSSQQLLSWLIFPTTQEGPDYDLRNAQFYIHLVFKALYYTHDFRPKNREWQPI